MTADPSRTFQIFNPLPVNYSVTIDPRNLRLILDKSFAPSDEDSEDDFTVYRLSWDSFSIMIEAKRLRTADGELLETLGATKKAVREAFNSSMAKEHPTLRSWKSLNVEIDVPEGNRFQKSIFMKMKI